MEPILDHQAIQTAGDEPSAHWKHIVEVAVKHRVSDIHLTAQKLGCNLLLRIDGQLYPQTQLAPELSRKLIGHVQSIAGMDVAEHRKPHEGRLKADVADRNVELRISVVPTLHGQDMVVRVFDRAIGLFSIDELGMLENQQDVIDDIIERPNGLILVSGPTGSGKTTTMYSMLRMIAGAGRKICTIENPIEYDLNGVSQTQISPRVGLGFAEMLTALLRQDPDVIMVGEIRDTETARTAVRAANTGHLVLATTHASRASRAIETMLFLDVHPFFLATALRCVIAQVLVRTICPECRTELPETGEMLIEPKIRELLTDADEAHLSQGEGCPACHQSGYQGRRGLFELFVPDETTRTMILNRAPAGEIDEYIETAETLSLTDVGKLAALRGQTTIEEIVSVLPNF